MTRQNENRPHLTEAENRNQRFSSLHSNTNKSSSILKKGNLSMKEEEIRLAGRSLVIRIVSAHSNVRMKSCNAYRHNELDTIIKYFSSATH